MSATGSVELQQDTATALVNVNIVASSATTYDLEMIYRPGGDGDHTLDGTLTVNGGSPYKTQLKVEKPEANQRSITLDIQTEKHIFLNAKVCNHSIDCATFTAPPTLSG